MKGGGNSSCYPAFNSIAKLYPSPVHAANRPCRRRLFSKGTVRPMQIPSRKECISLLVRTEMPEHIQKHSVLVAEVTLYLGRLLNRNGALLDLALLEASALLHDIGKPASLATGQDHAALGARMLEGFGYDLLAPIVREHIWLEPAQVEGPITESLLVNYSDKRVRHDRIVLLEDRFEDLIARYARTETHAVKFREKLGVYRALESGIFSHLAINPAGPEIMGLGNGANS